MTVGDTDQAPSMIAALKSCPATLTATVVGETMSVVPLMVGVAVGDDAVTPPSIVNVGGLEKKSLSLSATAPVRASTRPLISAPAPTPAASWTIIVPAILAPAPMVAAPSTCQKMRDARAPLIRITLLD